MTNKSDIAISVRNLSKSYTIAHNAAKHSTMGEALMHRLKNPVQRVEKETFWALKDVSFDIHKGDVVGIIGRNGAGKSTLLKVLSRITEPTSGKAIMNGRVGSLLEVGTGFHPELTGRENIYMNGAILGMTKREIAKHFDDIVAFAEVEQFLDTPVKRYSSGMYVRLAFAVAAHLTPDILIVDEVLAVGDAAFQKKCLGKMQDVANKGRTVLFVSHNMATIRQLCQTAILFKNGHLINQSEIDRVVGDYYSESENISSEWLVNKNGFRLAEIMLRDANTGQITKEPVFNQDYELVVTIEAEKQFSGGSLVCWIRDRMGSLVSTMCTLEEGVDSLDFSQSVSVTFVLPRLQLLPNKYLVSVTLARPNDPTTLLNQEDALTIQVQPNHVRGGSWAYEAKHGFVRIADGVSIVDGCRSMKARLQGV